MFLSLRYLYCCSEFVFSEVAESSLAVGSLVRVLVKFVSLVPVEFSIY